MTDLSKFGLFETVSCLHCGRPFYLQDMESHLMISHDFKPHQPPPKRPKRRQDILPGLEGFRQKIGVE